MPNLFIDTGYQLTEEDRLTNALIALLEHADREVLLVFLQHITTMSPRVDDPPAHFELQPVFSSSRPDARIVLSELEVVIESKRGDDLDNDQFRRHWAHIREQGTKPTILVCLTGSQVSPRFVSELNEDAPDRFEAAHLSWSDWLGSVVELQKNFEHGTATRLLLAQFEEYMRSLGYWYFDGSPIERIRDYGHTLQRHYQFHLNRTRPYLLQRMERLTDLVADQAHRQDSWNVRDWGPRGAFGSRRTGIVLADIVIYEVGAHTRFRLSLEFDAEQQLEFRYYLTMPSSEPHFSTLGDYLLEHRSKLESQAPFAKYGYWRDHKGFHIRKTAPLKLVHAFLNGKTGATEKLSGEVTTMVNAIDCLLENFVAN